MLKSNLRKRIVDGAYVLDIDTDEVVCNDTVMSLVEYFLVKGRTVESITNMLYRRLYKVAKENAELYPIWKDGFNSLVKQGVRDFVECCDEQRGRYGLYMVSYEYENGMFVFIVEDDIRFRLFLHPRAEETNNGGIKN